MSSKVCLKIILICSIAILFNGCYLIKQGVYLFKYTSSAKSTRKMLKNENLPVKTRQFIELANKIRNFAKDSIGLVENKSYTQYVKVDRKYLVDVVSAAEELSFTQYKWCFPIFGCFPNKGFFVRKDAETEAAKLSNKGYDVIIDEVDAFSTLGILSDPLYSFMEEFSSYELASLIIHELTHATVFVKNQLQFNEELATYVGTQGALKFIKENDSTGMYNRVVLYLQDREVYLNLLRDLYKNLGHVYATEKDSSEARRLKKEIIEEFKNKVKINYDSLFMTKSFKEIPDIKINNAHLAIRMTYTLDLKLYDDFRNQAGYDLKQFVGYVKTLKKVKEPKREIQKEIEKQHAFSNKQDN